VALGEEPADRLEVAALERAHGPLDPLVLADDVLAAPNGLLVQTVREPLHHRHVHVAERPDRWLVLGDDRYGPLALLAAGVVRGRVQAAGRARVAHHEDVLLEREGCGAVLQASAVEEHRRASLPERRRELVHQAALHADVLVLRPLTQLREAHAIDAVRGQIGRVEERPGRRQLERGG
jgi:hypothetical protein